jgi:hypothetical protein
MLNKVRTVAQREAKILPFAAMGRSSDVEHQSVDPDQLIADGRPGHWTTAPPLWQRLLAEQLESDEAFKTITVAIDQLPPEQQEVLTLRDVHGWTADEVCHNPWHLIGQSTGAPPPRAHPSAKPPGGAPHRCLTPAAQRHLASAFGAPTRSNWSPSTSTMSSTALISSRLKRTSMAVKDAPSSSTRST